MEVQLSAEQKAIATSEPTLETCNLVLASAGSGKSFSMAQRTKYLIQEHKISPSKILLMTFSNRAAKDLSSKVKESLQCSQKEMPTVGTIHSVCLNILKNLSGKQYVILTQWQNTMLIRDILEEYYDVSHYPKYITTPAAKAIENTITDIYLNYDYNKYKAPDESEYTISDNSEEYSKDLQLIITYKDFYNLLNLITEAKEIQDLLSFSDIVYKAFKLLVEDEDALASVRAQYVYVTMDEAQDCTPLYFLYLYNVFNTGNTTIVGDKTQWLYSFSHADYSYMDSELLKTPYKKVNEFTLSTNYRSSTPIVNLGNMLRGYGKSDIFANVCKANSSLPKRVSIKETKNQISEAKYIVQHVKKLISEGEELSDIYVITRTNRYISTLLEPAFSQANIPYIVQSSKSRKLSDRAEILYIINILNLVVSPPRAQHFIFKQIIPHILGVGPKREEKVLNSLKGSIFDLRDDKAFVGENVDKVLEVVQNGILEGLEVDMLEDLIRQVLLVSKLKLSPKDIDNIIQLFTNWATLYMEDHDLTLEQAIPEISISLDSTEEIGKNAVRLTNIHQCLALDNTIEARLNGVQL